MRREPLHDGAGNDAGPIFAMFHWETWLGAGRLQAKPLHRPAARCYFYVGNTCVLVAVLHIRLSRPGRPGVFV